MTTIYGNNTGGSQFTTVGDEGTQANFTIGGGSDGSAGVYAFTRARMVTFIAEGLKPNTVYHPFFNNVSVAKYCTTVGKGVEAPPVLDAHGRIPVESRQIKTDNIGNVTGNFFIPSNTFASGANVFKLVDHTIVRSGRKVPDPLYGSAEAVYESGSILKMQQSQVTSLAAADMASLVTPVVSETITAEGDLTAETVVDLNPIILCESWYFEYILTTTTASDTFLITTGTSDIPDAFGETGSPITQEGATDTVIHVSTTANADGTYDHLYQFTNENKRAIFRKEWVGETVTDPLTELPDLTDFRPSGLDAAIAVDVIGGVNGWHKKADVACPIEYSSSTPCRTDPLAQSFFVDAKAYPQGMFVTSIGVYFKTVDHSAQVVMEIREMSNGLPSSRILPKAHAVVPGYATQASKNASVATIFRFRHPVYLKPSTDYCFVLKSSSLGYNVWSSTVGNIDVKTGKVIDSQPFSGTCFKSENNYTWIPSPLEDLKFDLYKANFDTTVEGDLIFTPKEFSVDENTGAYTTRGAEGAITCYYSTAHTIPLSYLSTTKDSQDVVAKIPLHNLIEGDYLFIRGLPTPAKVDAYNGIRAQYLNGLHQVADVVDGDHVMFNDIGAGVASKTGPLQIREIRGILNNEPSTMPSFVEPVAAVQYIDPTQNVLATVPATTQSFVQPTAPLLVSQNSFVVFTNIQVNEAMVDYVGTVLKHTNVREYVTLAPGDDYATPTTTEYADREVFYQYTDQMRVAWPKNESIHVGTLGSDADMSYPLSCKVNLKLTSDNKDISPVLDTSSLSLVTKTFKIDNQGEEFDEEANPVNFIGGGEYGVYGDTTNLGDIFDTTKNSELSAHSGVALAKYVSQVVNLDQSFNKLALFINGNCAAPATFDIYIRTSTDPITHIDQPWVAIPFVSEGVYTALPASPDRDTLTEWYFEYVNDTKYFTVFDVKLVMRSTNSSYVPKIYGLRTIATTVLPEIE